MTLTIKHKKIPTSNPLKQNKCNQQEKTETKCIQSQGLCYCWKDCPLKSGLRKTCVHN